MGIQIAHFPTVKTLEEFEFKFQPSIDQKLVRELATGSFIAGAENVLMFGPPGVGKTHLAIALGRAPVESGHSVLFVTATSLLAQLSRAQVEGKLADQIAFYAKPKLLGLDELGYLPLEKQTAHLFFQLVSRRYERGSMLITTHQTITQWPRVRRDDCLRGPRPRPSPQPRPGHPGRQLPTTTEEPSRASRLGKANALNTRVGSVLVAFRGQFLMAFDSSDRDDASAFPDVAGDDAIQRFREPRFFVRREVRPLGELVAL